MFWKTAPPAGPPQALARASNAFGFDLYRRLRAAEGNAVFSPASVSTVLTMALAGARGATAAELQRVLHLDLPADEALRAAGTLLAALQDPQQPVALRIANRLFGEQACRFVPAYLEATRAALGAPLEPLDFRRSPEAARARINAWVEERTEQRIRGLIPPGAVDPPISLVLVNALYFLGDWAEPFEAGLTRPWPFHLPGGDTRPVPSMRAERRFAFAENGQAKALSLAYKGGALSMLFVLPEARDGLPALEESLTASGLESLVGSLRQQKAFVLLPRFRVEPGAALNLVPPLRSLGLDSALDRGRADFTGMADPPDPDQRVFIGGAFHKAFVRVDEEGTEATAATALAMEVTSARPRVPPRRAEFIADHPFLFFIRHEASGLVLFQGRIADP
jgi:serpin B